MSRGEEKRKNERDGELKVLLLKDPLCAMLPTRNQSPTCAMAPKVQGLMREERMEKMVEIFVVEWRKPRVMRVCEFR
jgi:hypothetical protein